MSPRLTVLVLTASPDDRPSTRSLRAIVTNLEARPTVDVHVWFLRDGPCRDEWTDFTVLDELRTWFPARVLDLMRLKFIADRLRGFRLRRWANIAAPDVAVFDDGLGQRAVTGRKIEVSVLRANEVPPASRALETVPLEPVDADIVIGWPDDRGTPTIPTLRSSERLIDVEPIHRRSTPAQRNRTRTTLRLPLEPALIIGWSNHADDAGLPEFLAAVSALEPRQGRQPHAMWLCGVSTPQAMQRRSAVATAAGISERTHFRTTSSISAALCGDAILLPATPDEADDMVRAAVASGLKIVRYEAASPQSTPAATESAGVSVRVISELVDALSSDRVLAAKSAANHLDVGIWVDELLAAIERSRGPFTHRRDGTPFGRHRRPNHLRTPRTGIGEDFGADRRSGLLST